MSPLPRALRQALLATGLMLLCAALAWVLTPTHRLVDRLGALQLEQAMPTSFGDWHAVPSQFTTVINPQQTEMLQRIYSQTLTRVYANSQGQRIMLSLAYGEDQRDGLQLHFPEICYPAQGFRLLSQQSGQLDLQGYHLPIKRLSTIQGSTRKESVTYWTLVGLHPFRGNLGKKLTEMSYGLKGDIPDGLLFRISSVEPTPEDGYALHQQFASALYAALPDTARGRLMGVAPVPK